MVKSELAVSESLHLMHQQPAENMADPTLPEVSEWAFIQNSKSRGRVCKIDTPLKEGRKITKVLSQLSCPW